MRYKIRVYRSHSREICNHTKCAERNFPTTHSLSSHPITPSNSERYFTKKPLPTLK